MKIAAEGKAEPLNVGMQLKFVSWSVDWFVKNASRTFHEAHSSKETCFDRDCLMFIVAWLIAIATFVFTTALSNAQSL